MIINKYYILINDKAKTIFIILNLQRRCNLEQARRWNADKPLAALDGYIPTWIYTSPANHRPANVSKYFFNYWKEIVKYGAISGWIDEDQLQIWSSHSMILRVQIIAYIIN